MFFKRKVKIKFAGRKHSLQGLISTILGAVGILGIGILIYISTYLKGNSNVWTGFFGLFVFAVTLTGLIIGVLGFKQKDIYYTLPILGTVLNGMVFLGTVILYFLGLSMMV